VKVSVLGAGQFGTTIASLVAVRNETMLWARSSDVAAEINEQRSNSSYLPGAVLPATLRATEDLELAVSSAELIVVAVPTHGVRAVLTDAAPFLHPWIPIVSVSKGLEPGTLLRMTEVAKELFPGHPVAALSGPNIAGEIMAGQAAASVVATDDLAVGAELQRVLSRGFFRVYLNDDVAGCELGGAMKNVIAIAAGMAQGLSVGDNTRAAVISRGLAEITRLGVAMGGRAETFAGLTGLGDLLVTCMSPRSRNRAVGEQLGRGRTIDEVLAEMTMVAEGVRTAGAIVALADRHEVAMPICDHVHRVVSGEISGSEAFRGLQPIAGHEADPG
jgi:glycerol-3-phosphate dehydrogenase (NAD(P)+)